MIDKIKVIEDTEISIYKWCGLFFEHFTADRENYICYEYKWGDLYIPSLDDFSLTLITEPDSTSAEWYLVEGGDICGEVGSENYHFANEELEKEFYKLYESESEESPLHPDEVFWEVLKDYPTDTLEDYEYWLRLDPEHKEMVKAFTPFIRMENEKNVLVSCYKGYKIFIFEQNADREWTDYFNMSEDEQDHNHFPENACGDYRYEVRDCVNKLIAQDDKTMGDEGACICNAKREIDLIIGGFFLKKGLPSNSDMQ